MHLSECLPWDGSDFIAVVQRRVGSGDDAVRLSEAGSYFHLEVTFQAQINRLLDEHASLDLEDIIRPVGRLQNAEAIYEQRVCFRRRNELRLEPKAYAQAARCRRLPGGTLQRDNDFDLLLLDTER